MSFTALKNAHVHYRPPGAKDVDTGNPTFGTQSRHYVRLEQGVTTVRSEGLDTSIIVDRITSDLKFFEKGGLLWFPGADKNEISEGRLIRNVGKSSAINHTMHWAEV